MLAVNVIDKPCCLLIERGILLEGLMFVTVLWHWRLAIVAHGGLVLADEG